MRKLQSLQSTASALRGGGSRFDSGYRFRFYAMACDRGEGLPGRKLAYETGAIVSSRYIVDIPK